jgi:hypothetical protein
MVLQILCYGILIQNTWYILFDYYDSIADFVLQFGFHFPTELDLYKRARKIALVMDIFPMDEDVPVSDFNGPKGHAFLTEILFRYLSRTYQRHRVIPEKYLGTMIQMTTCELPRPARPSFCVWDHRKRDSSSHSTWYQHPDPDHHL